jgi:hypothetical protein
MNEYKKVEGGLSMKINESRTEVRNSIDDITINGEIIKENSNIVNEAISFIWNGLEEVKARIQDGFTRIEEMH